MPVAQHGIDLFDKTRERARSLCFLEHCQQQAIAASQSKIASLTFVVTPIAPWEVLSAMGEPHQRHAYYDAPQQPSMVGVGEAIAFNAAGSKRFSQAQDFITFWQRQFVYAEPVMDGECSSSEVAAIRAQASKGHFFCSATFFDEVLPGPAYFEPAYVLVPQVQVTTGSITTGSTGFNRSVVTFNQLISADSDIEALNARLYQQLHQLVTANKVIESRVGYRGGQSVAKDVSSFESAVSAALRRVRGGDLHKDDLHKVVLADVMDVALWQPVDVVRSLQALRQNHPDCTVFSVGNGKGQSFIGASPERLLNITNGQLVTDALAGSAPRSAHPGIDRQISQSLLSSQKERYEHSVVVEFIVEQLRSLGLNPHYALSPQLLQLLHIQHLHTPIRAAIATAKEDEPKVKQKVRPLDILAKLHPTPAVAGLPREAACDFIRRHETFDRGLYTAPLGWIDTEGNSEFVVGIRSALIDGCKARLYAGAGIVAASEPAKELAEIKLKLQSLLNALV